MCACRTIYKIVKNNLQITIDDRGDLCLNIYSKKGIFSYEKIASISVGLRVKFNLNKLLERKYVKTCDDYN